MGGAAGFSFSTQDYPDKRAGSIGCNPTAPVRPNIACGGSGLGAELRTEAFEVTVVGVRICDIAAEKLGEHDFGGIVWDEIAGYLITMWLVPLTWQTIIAGFILFRFFDILKPWPIKWLDRKVHGGFGIMIDDVLAGVFAGALLLLAVDWGWIR